jgi:hypothetical protein
VISVYRAQWFDPREGSWRDASDGTLRSNNIGEITLPESPSNLDWGLKLSYSAPILPKHS